MSEEEKAIERFKKEKDRLDKICYLEKEKKAIERAKFLNNIDTYLEKEMLTNLLNLIEKQQKEIDHLKSEKEVNYISKEKIRELMKHYQKLYKEDNSPNEFLKEQTYLSKLSLLYDILEE